MSEQAWQLALFAAWALLDLFLLTVVARRGKPSPLRRWLVLFLLVDLAFSLSHLGRLSLLTLEDNWWRLPWLRGLSHAGTIAFASLPALYVLIIGRALPSRLTRWAATPAATVAVAAYGIGMGFWVMADRIGWGWAYDEVGRSIYVLVQLAVGFFGLAAAIVHMRTSGQSTTQRRQSWSYLLAFAWRDLHLLAVYGLMSYYLVIEGRPDHSVARDYLLLLVNNWALLARELVFVVLLSYGILAGRVIDLDRRLQWTVSKATLAAIFIGVFVGVQTFVSEALTSGAGLLAGSVAAGVLVFALAPLQRAADRIGNAALRPRNEDAAFYEEQIRIAYSDGTIGAKERATLASIRARIDLPADEALAIEERVAAG